MWWKIGCLPCSRWDSHLPLLPLPDSCSVQCPGLLSSAADRGCLCLGECLPVQLQLYRPLHAVHSGPLPSSVATTVAPATSERPESPVFLVGGLHHLFWPLHPSLGPLSSAQSLSRVWLFKTPWTARFPCPSPTPLSHHQMGQYIYHLT